MRRALLSGFAFGIVMLASCGAAKFVEPESWTLRSDGRLRASQRKEDFSFAEWKAKYLAPEGKDYGVTLTPGGVAAIAAELSRRNAKIIQLENKLAECR